MLSFFMELVFWTGVFVVVGCVVVIGGSCAICGVLWGMKMVIGWVKGRINNGK